MSKTKKIILGIATLWPIIYMFIFFSLVFSFITNVANPEVMFGYLFGAHLFTMLLIVILLIIYIRDVFKNDMVLETRKTLWTILLIFGNMIAMPIYWYLHIWKKPTKG
ncbi:MAG: hypothetical protein WC924_03160 [Candidatus Gracilibacteria bacterium]